MTDKEHNIDELLRRGLVHVPQDFHTEVMQEIANFERANRQTSAQQQLHPDPPAGLDWWQWLALVCGGVLGAGQVIRYIFAVWLVSAAG